MSLTQEQIEKLSKDLSKLKTTNKNIEWDLNSILKYIDQLNEVDTTWVVPTVSVISKKWNDLRKDELKEKDVTREELLWCSNQKIIQDQIAVSNIL